MSIFNALSAETIKKVFAFGMGYGLAYAFGNPDKHRGWQCFPSFSQKHYVYISCHKIDLSKEENFLFTWKNLARYCQHQPGYLYTRLLRAKDMENSEYQYINITTWLTATDKRVAYSKPTAIKFVNTLGQYCYNDYVVRLYKVLVDDSEYIPPPI